MNWFLERDVVCRQRLARLPYRSFTGRRLTNDSSKMYRGCDGGQKGPQLLDSGRQQQRFLALRNRPVGSKSHDAAENEHEDFRSNHGLMVAWKGCYYRQSTNEMVMFQAPAVNARAKTVVLAIIHRAAATRFTIWRLRTFGRPAASSPAALHGKVFGQSGCLSPRSVETGLGRPFDPICWVHMCKAVHKKCRGRKTELFIRALHVCGYLALIRHKVPGILYTTNNSHPAIHTSWSYCHYALIMVHRKTESLE